MIAYVDEPGVPQYTATIRRWSLKPEFTDGLFTFEAPEGAQKIDPQRWQQAAAALAAASAPAVDRPAQRSRRTKR